MEESYEKAVDEFKRVDHLFYVSLKYTRTVDVIKSVMERMISCIDYCMECMLKQAKDKGTVDEIPKNAGLKADLVKKMFGHEPEIVEAVIFYQLLKKLVRSEYTKKEEFRRHVTMTATIDKGEIVEVNIDILKEYYDKTKHLLGVVRAKIFQEEHNG